MAVIGIDKFAGAEDEVSMLIDVDDITEVEDTATGSDTEFRDVSNVLLKVENVIGAEDVIAGKKIGTEDVNKTLLEAETGN